MKAYLILCRHGNTFRKGEKVFWVGAGQDLPLTEEGLMQARLVGEALSHRGIQVDRILSGPLLRTRVFAQRVGEIAAPTLTCSLDPRLDELDYGAWSGLTDEEIAARYGASVLADWRDRSIRPSVESFLPSEEAVREQTQALLSDIQGLGGISLAVTSNGRLREMARFVLGSKAGAATSLSVSTGSTCILGFDGLRWKSVIWNVKPDGIPAIRV